MSRHTRQSHKSVLAPLPQSAKPALPSPLAPAIRYGTASGGRTLDKHTQATMSAHFGHDFSSVRIHTDARAGESAEAMGANAYAMGSDIVFGGGKYNPGSPETERLLAHELTHVVQQSQHGLGDPAHVSDRDDPSEREAENAAGQIRAGGSVQVQAAPQAALARDEDGGGWFSSLASSAWDDTKAAAGDVKAAAGAVYNGYEKETDFKKLNGELDSGVNWVEKNAAAGNQKMVDDSKGHWYEGLAKADAWVNNEATQATGGLVKGVGDLTTGVVGGLAHPIDAAAGMEGILEHNMTVPGLGSMLKAGHGAYDLLSGKKDGEYGSSWGDLANHVFNPLQQMKDDQKFDTSLATGIIAPDKNKDGTTDWSAWKNKPIEAATRAATNIAPFFMGMGEADTAKAADVGEAAQATHTPVLPEPVPDTIPEIEPATVKNPKPAVPNWTEEPPNINPNDPRIEPPSVPVPPDTVPDAPAPDTRREVPLPPRIPETEIPSQLPSAPALPDSTPYPYIRPYEEEWLRTPWRKPNIPEIPGIN